MFQPSRSPALIAPRHTLLLAQSCLAARDDQALASDRCPGWWKGLLGIDQTDVVQALAGQTGEWLALPTNNDGRQASFLDPTEGVLFPEEIEESEDQLASRLQIHWGFPDHPIQDRPSVGPPIIRRLISSRLSTGGRRHLWWIRQHKVECLTGHRREQIAQSHFDLHLEAVHERVAPSASDACLDDIDCHHPPRPP